jgi:hypothetical protein
MGRGSESNGCSRDQCRHAVVLTGRMFDRLPCSASVSGPQAPPQTDPAGHPPAAASPRIAALICQGRVRSANHRPDDLTGDLSVGHRRPSPSLCCCNRSPALRSARSRISQARRSRLRIIAARFFFYPARTTPVWKAHPAARGDAANGSHRCGRGMSPGIRAISPGRSAR